MAARLQPDAGHHFGGRLTPPCKPTAHLAVIHADILAQFANPSVAKLGASDPGDDVDGPLVEAGAAVPAEGEAGCSCRVGGDPIGDGIL
ncbi:hypothetical protein [Methylobacterium platani]|uniref:hypothetical protein n=1 Tax=Methylobacterium platani TaxID=427683 RepID=UPI0012E2CE81|nr:hypothetical protein [Methylobacterium platani]